MTNPADLKTTARRIRIDRTAAAVVLATLLPITVAFAELEGYYIETLNRTSGIQDEGTSEDLTKTYLAGDKMAVINSGPDATDMIMDPNAGIITFINHAEKEYLEIDVNAVMESLSGPAGEQMRAMIGDMTVTVEETDQQRRIGEWETRLYRVNKSGMMGIEQNIWAAADVDIDVTRYTDMMSLSGPGGVLASSPAGIAQREEMSKIKGYPILTETQLDMMGTQMTTETEVQVIRWESIPAEIFRVPDAYSAREMGMMGMPTASGAHP
ncbi:hypothetical protein CKO25_17040 [Thiocapsa imhoffii]|uniref:DUF4412 domain-containing protein n=1 Tax=Thiocapsa imhoffii TaxID=382777 RepID=A0A9X1B9X0_9GAMM|nr:hypothetical protein [Thiocapsa imhoffii]MBK1646322.1 hypothetical protein [Thiocapsa imhoffii]